MSYIHNKYLVFNVYLAGHHNIITAAKDCSCNDYLNSDGYGRCKKGKRSGKPYCFVNEPSTCSDLFFSKSSRKQYSYDACVSYTGTVKI